MTVAAFVNYPQTNKAKNKTKTLFININKIKKNLWNKLWNSKFVRSYNFQLKVIKFIFNSFCSLLCVFCIFISVSNGRENWQKVNKTKFYSLTTRICATVNDL